MGNKYSAEEIEEFRRRYEHMKSSNKQLKEENRLLHRYVRKLEKKVKDGEARNKEIERTLRDAITVYEEREKDMRAQFETTIAKFADMEIAAVQASGKSKGYSLNTKTSATPSKTNIKKPSFPGLSRLFKAPPVDEEMKDLRTQIKVLEMDKTRQVLRTKLEVKQKAEEVRLKEKELGKLEKKMSDMDKEREQLAKEKDSLENSLPSPCAICLDKSPNCTFTPCGHLCTCMSCGRKVQTCPICRKKIKRRVKVFQT